MAAGTPFLFAPTKRKMQLGGYNLSSDTLKAALTTNAQALTPGFIGSSGDARYADLTAQVANGNGYTTGGQTLTTKVIGYRVIAAAIVAGGTGGTNGTQTVTGTTGTGTKFQASVTVAGGIVTAVNSITVNGAYTALPTNPAVEPVTGAGSLTGCTLLLTLGTYLTFDNPSWTSSTIIAKYLVVYDDTATNKDLIAACDLETTVGTGVSTTNGTLTYQLNAAGLYTLD